MGNKADILYKLQTMNVWAHTALEKDNVVINRETWESIERWTQITMDWIKEKTKQVETIPTGDVFDVIHKCSNCGYGSLLSSHQYCSNCGCKIKRWV